MRRDALDRGKKLAKRGAVEARRTGGLLGRAWHRAAPVLTAAASLPLVIAAEGIALGSRVGAWIGRRIDAVSAAVRPELALAALAAFACAALAASQFVHFTAVEVGAPEYKSGIGRVAPVPLADPRDAGEAHGYVLLGVAAVAFFFVLATLSGRWRLGRVVVLCGLIGIGVSLLIDIPRGLDAGRAGISYAGAQIEFTEGFYAQLAASAVLALSGALLGTFVHRAHPERDSRRRRRGARRLSADTRFGRSPRRSGA